MSHSKLDHNIMSEKALVNCLSNGPELSLYDDNLLYPRSRDWYVVLTLTAGSPKNTFPGNDVFSKDDIYTLINSLLSYYPYHMHLM